MKRVLSCVLVLILTFISLGTTSIHAIAAGTPTIGFDSIETESGEIVSLDLSLNNNPGIAGLAVSLKYDTESLKLIETKKGTLFSGFTAAKNFAWDEGEDVTADGVLATFTFAVSETAAAGDYEIEVIVRSCTNENLEDIDNLSIVNGNISVKAKHVETTGVNINKESLLLKTYESETLIATVTPDNATNKAVAWKSSDTTVAKVDSNGKVTAVKKGTATITVTTVEGSFSDTCNVSVSCSHVNTTVYPANNSTCLVEGNAEYSICDDCGIVVSGSDSKLPLTDHKGGTATCKDKAICIVCSQPYGNYGGHTLTKHSRNEADHNNIGNIEYWTCDVCNKYFNDEKGAVVISQADTIIPKVPHSHSVDWSKSDTQHWRECGCGNKIEIDTHKYTNDCDTTCNVCDYTRNITHDWNTTYTIDDNGHWIECKECGLKKDEGAHNGGTATCKNKAICDTCGKEYGTLTTHSYKEIVDVKYCKDVATCNSAAVYYKSCEFCEITSANETFTNGDVDATNHSGETEIKGEIEATCTMDGYSGDTYCKDCDAKILNGKTVEAGHKTIKIEEVPSTHEKDGNIEYFICYGCDRLFSDKNATTEISFADTVIAKGQHSYCDTYERNADSHWKACSCGNVIQNAPHNFGEWFVTKEATETEKGNKEKVCSVCGYKVVEEIPVVKNEESLNTGDKEENIPSTNNNVNINNIPEKSPQTGDASNIILWITLLILSGTGIVITKYLRRTYTK